MLTTLLTTGINALSNAASAANAANSIRTSISSIRDRYDLHYPLSMTGINQLGDADNTLEFIRPTIVFTCNSRASLTPALKIAFPIPQGLEFSDGASYDDNALGFVASGLINSAQSAISASQSGQNPNDIVSGTINSLKQNFSTTAPGAGYAAAMNTALSDSNKSAIGIAMKMTMNRHVTTEFTGVGTRNYGFKFKMIGSSKEESDMIRNICDGFREGLYPEGDNIALRYPPTWTIRFMLKNSDITYIPKIWECYLTSVNVSYNSSSGLWHSDGSPLECDITVAFKETRALTHKDILDLKKSPFVNIPNQNARNVPSEANNPNSTTPSNKQPAPSVAKSQ